MPRLLVCLDCPSLTKLGDFDGPPEYDVELEAIVQQHQHLDIPEERRKGGNLVKCDPATYAHLDVETEIRKELAQNHILVNEARDQFKEDALACFNQHHRPALCGDYETEPKRIGPADVPKAWRRYLCHHCPVHSNVITDVRLQKGYYN